MRTNGKSIGLPQRRRARGLMRNPPTSTNPSLTAFAFMSTYRFLGPESAQSTRGQLMANPWKRFNASLTECACVALNLVPSLLFFLAHSLFPKMRTCKEMEILKFSSIGARVGVGGVNSPSWVHAWLATLHQAMAVVPLHSTLTSEQLVHVCSVTKTKIIFGDIETLKRSAKIIRATSVSHLISIGPEPTFPESLKVEGYTCLTLSELGELGTKTGLTYEAVPMSANHVHSITFTSGSTGMPKGTLLSTSFITSECGNVVT